MTRIRKSLSNGLRTHAARFGRDDAGVMAPQILFFFFLMLLVGGVAVDVMRFETRRVTVQQTMDRATLAAASLEQTLNPTAVVNDYFTKAGIGADLDNVTVVESMNSRIVKATATVKSDNYFMSMMEVPYLEAQNRSQAEQRINDIEIMLVLDVSGSMGGTKIANLRSAAKNFIDKVMGNDPLGRISIGIIPYNAQVNLGPTLRSKYTVSYAHGTANVNCLELPSSVFGSLALSRTTAYPMMAHADVVSSTNQTTSYVAYNDSSYGAPVNDPGRRWCNPTTANSVTLPSKDRTALKARVDLLTAGGNTSILLGMRWATALIDPSAAPMYNELIGSGAMAANMTGRPYMHDNKDAMKVIVLMTDGEHVAHNRVVDTYKTGNSPIYRSTGDGNYSIFHDRSGTTLDYWVPHRNEWRTAAWNSGGGVSVQTWNQVWANTRVTWVAWQLYARALGTSSGTRSSIYTSWMNTFLGQYQSVSSMNSLLSSNCTVARNAGVLVYGIAFEAPQTGKDAIKDCASKPASTYYYEPVGSEIGTAFDLIAANLSQLRLTQ